MTVSGLMDHRLFKAVSTSAAEALTAIGAKRGKDEETTCILGFHQIGPRYASFFVAAKSKFTQCFSHYQ